MKKLYILLILSCILFIITGCSKGYGNSIYIITNNTEVLTNGYSTVSTQNHKYTVDPSVVSNFQSIDNEDDTRTYTISIYKDLKWSDGEPLTAEDYVFSILLDNNPIALQVRYIDNLNNDEIKGINKYRSLSNNENGDSELIGLKLIDEYTFSITSYTNDILIEERLYDIKPLPKHILAPSCEVVHGEVGAKLINFSKDEFKEQYIFNFDNSVTCGPYYFVKYTSNMGEVYKINKFYKGNFEGQKPQIETINVKKGWINQKDQIDIIVPYYKDRLYEDIINQNREDYELIPIPTNDHNTIEISCDEPSGATSSINVRQALAYILNKDESENSPNIRIHALYTSKDWQYARSLDENGEIKGRDSQENEVSLNPYHYNLNKAEELLTEDGWIWADQEAEVGYDKNNPDHIYRYKKFNSGYWKDQVLRLDIKYGPNSFNDDSYPQYESLKNNAKEIGINILLSSKESPGNFGGINDGYDEPTQNDTTGEWIIPHYNKDSDERQYQVTFKYRAIISTILKYHNIVSIEGWGKSNYIYDLELIQYTKKMLNASNDEEYLIAWQQFQYRYNYLLPSISLGNNPDYIIYNKQKIKGFEKAYMMNWYEALLYCTVN